MALAPDGRIIIADEGRHRIVAVNPEGVASILAGSGEPGFTDGGADEAQFNQPYAVSVDAAGRVAVSDLANHRIRLIVQGQVTTLAGTGVPGLLDGVRGQGTLLSPRGLAWAPDGVLWMSDWVGNCLRTVSTDGTVQTVSRPIGLLETEEALDAYFDTPIRDGALAQADFRWPQGIRFDQQGSLWVCDWQSARIRRVTDGQVSTVELVNRGPAGNPDSGELDTYPFQGVTGNYSIDFDPDGYPVVNNVWWHTLIRLQ
jgi:sugar lactone lactonase YvrE